MAISESDVRSLIERIAEEVRPDAKRRRTQSSIQLVLESFAPNHIITELLQNADDVEATTAEIELTESGVFFVHNGYEFDELHLRALCDIGETTKKPGVHIGFMGIGFKAAFKISDRPHVFSGPYSFYFTRKEVIVPHWLDDVSADIEKRIKPGLTTFFLPFRRDLPSEIVKSLKETVFAKLEPLCLVFLKNIREIKIRFDSSTRILLKTTEAYSGSSLNMEKCFITERKGGKERTYSYLVFNKTLKIPEFAKDDYRARESRRSELKTTDVTLTFQLKNDLVEPAKSVLYTFLPTPFQTGLRFTVNCDFLLNTQRSEPDFTSKWNLWLLESTGDILKEIVEQFARDEKQKLCFYDALPRKKEVSERFFVKIAEPLLDHMRNNPSIVTANGNLAKPSEVVLASAEIQEIIPPRKADAQYYANASIRGNAFLKEELAIRDLNGTTEEREYALEALGDEEWLASLNAKQVRAIYEFLYHKVYGEEKEQWKLSWYEHSELEKRLKEMKIVRSTDRLYHRAEETLLPEKSEVRRNELISLPCLIFVDPGVLSDQSRELLKKLGAKDLAEESIVSRILDSQSKDEWEKWTVDERLRCVSYVGKWLKESGYPVKREIKSKLGNLVLPTAEGDWAIASSCYIPSSELKEVLPKANFIDLPKMEQLVRDVGCFLKVLGVMNFPRVTPLGKRERWGDTPPSISKERWQAYWWWLYEVDHCIYEGKDHTVSTVCLDGFDKCVSSQDVEVLTKYLGFLLKHWDEYYNLHRESLHRWSYYGPRHEDVPSYFTYQLKTSKWLPTTGGLGAPSEVFAPLPVIRRVGRSLIPYLRISEEQAKQHKGFLRFLGVQTGVSLQMLLSILDSVRNAEVNDALKAQLRRVYQRMATLCEDERIEEEVYILDMKSNFQPSQELYWLDDPMIEDVFGEDMPAAWVPDNISRPHVEALFNALGVTKVSSMMERKRIDDGHKVIEDTHLTDELRRKQDYLYSVLLHHKAAKAEEFPDFVKKMTAVKVNQLKLQLKVLDIMREIEVPCFCSEEEKRIYISSKAQITDIARELARAFEAPLGSEFTLNFVLSPQSSESILEQLQRSSIRMVPIPKPEIELDLEELKRLEGVVAGEVGLKPVTESIVDKFKEMTPLKTIETPTQLTRTQMPSPEVTLDVNEDELVKDVEGATRLLTGQQVQGRESSDVWMKSKKIEKVVTKPRVVVRPFVGVSTKKNWEPQILDGDRVFIEVGIEAAKIESLRTSIKPFKERMCKIVEAMGGNPDTVNICIASPETDADRRKGQLFFNILRNDKPLRWLVVVARELAYVKFLKPSLAYISLMTDLIVKALERIQEIYPEMFNKKNIG